MTFLYEDETYKKAEIEREFWEWATDSLEHYINHRIVNQAGHRSEKGGGVKI